MPPPRSTIRAKRVWAGIGIALLAHVLTILPMVVAAAVDFDDFAAGVGVAVTLIGQVVVFLGCLVVGVVLIAKNDGGVGVGLLIGWAVGLLVVPVVGFGLCLWLYNASGLAG
jgi:hypothetical protein